VVVLLNLARETDENHETFSQDTRCQVQDMNPKTNKKILSNCFRFILYNFFHSYVMLYEISVTVPVVKAYQSTYNCTLGGRAFKK
jgi:uncharacterized membrane protein